MLSYLSIFFAVQNEYITNINSKLSLCKAIRSVGKCVLSNGEVFNAINLNGTVTTYFLRTSRITTESFFFLNHYYRAVFKVFKSAQIRQL